MWMDSVTFRYRNSDEFLFQPNDLNLYICFIRSHTHSRILYTREEIVFGVMAGHGTDIHASFSSNIKFKQVYKFATTKNVKSELKGIEVYSRWILDFPSKQVRRYIRIPLLDIQRFPRTLGKSLGSLEFSELFSNHLKHFDII